MITTGPQNVQLREEPQHILGNGRKKPVRCVDLDVLNATTRGQHARSVQRQVVSVYGRQMTSHRKCLT